MGSNFAESFAEALPAGIDFSREMDRQRGAKSARRAGEIMAQMQAYDPFAGMADPSQQGLAEPGQATFANPNQGFDGAAFSQLSNEYFKAIAGIGDIREYAAAQQVYGNFRMNKINDYIDQGIAAYDQGDMQGATRALRGASAFMNPGITPEITVDPNSGAFVVANYENGKPHSGFAITRDQLMDIRGRNTDYNAWAQRDMADEHHKQEMGLRYAQFAASQKNQAARLALARTAADAKAESDAIKLATDKLELAQKQAEYDTYKSTQESDIASTNATNWATYAIDTEKEKNAPLVGAADAAEASNRKREALDESHAQYLKDLFGEGGTTMDGSIGDAFQLPVNPTSGGIPGTPAGSAIPQDGSSDTGNASLADQYSSLGMAIGGNAKGEKVAFDSLLYDPSPSGATLKQPVLDTMTKVADDIWDLNGGEEGEVDSRVASSMIVGAFNRSQTTQLQAEENPDTGEVKAYISDGVNRFEISPGSYQLLYTYQETYKQELARQQGREVPASNIAPEAQSIMPMPEAAPAIPDLPAVGGTPMGELTGPQRELTPAQQTAGIGSAGPAPAQLGGGYDTSAIPDQARPVVDDTVVGPSSGIREIHGPLDNAPTVQSVPELARAYLSWYAEGKPQNSPAMQQIRDILTKLPPMVAQKAATELYNASR